MISACATNTTVDPELLAPVRSSPRAPAACRLVTSHQECLFRYLMRPDDCGQRQFPSHSHWRRCVRYLRYGIPTWRRYSCGPVFRVCLEQYFQPLRSYVDSLPCQLLIFYASSSDNVQRGQFGLCWLCPVSSHQRRQHRHGLVHQRIYWIRFPPLPVQRAVGRNRYRLVQSYQVPGRLHGQCQLPGH